MVFTGRAQYGFAYSGFSSIRTITVGAGISPDSANLAFGKSRICQRAVPPVGNYGQKPKVFANSPNPENQVKYTT